MKSWREVSNKTYWFWESYEIIHSDIRPMGFPGDSGQTPARSICLKFAGPRIRITRHLQRSFLEWRIQRTSRRKTNRTHWKPEFVLYIDCSVFSCILGQQKLKDVIKRPWVFSGETWSEAENHISSLNKHYITTDLQWSIVRPTES